jgi:hypothetical protein
VTRLLLSRRQSRPVWFCTTFEGLEEGAARACVRPTAVERRRSSITPADTIDIFDPITGEMPMKLFVAAMAGLQSAPVFMRDRWWTALVDLDKSATLQQKVSVAEPPSRCGSANCL